MLTSADISATQYISQCLYCYSHDPTLLVSFVLTERLLLVEITYCVFKLGVMELELFNGGTVKIYFLKPVFEGFFK